MITRFKEILPVGTGKSQELTPEGLFTVKVKAVNPYYRKKNIPGGDPGIHLDQGGLDLMHEIPMAGFMGYMVQNQPSSVGKYISNGCVRMHKSDVERLYEKVPIGIKGVNYYIKRGFQNIGKKIWSH